VTETGELSPLCQWCASPITRTGSRGPVPTYCRRSCRQRAYEARHEISRPAGPDPALDAESASHLREQLNRVLDGLRDASRMSLILARGGGWTEGSVETHPAYEILLKAAAAAAESITTARDEYLA